MKLWHYLLIIIAKFIVDSNQCNSSALKCYECKICQSGVDAMCGEKHNFKVCKCRKGELGDLKTCENTGKSLSEALLFAEHGENMLCTKIVLNVRNNFLYTTCSSQV